MKEASAWLHRPRPNGGTLPLAIFHCDHCGRALYMTVRRQDWGQQFCVGCDEEKTGCYCPDAREMA